MTILLPLLAAAATTFPAAPPPVSGFHERPSYRTNDPSRPTVCLIHGANSTSGSFVYLVPLLEAEGVGVVLHDYPFERPLVESYARFVKDWKAFRDRTGDTRPWTVLTHSMGGLLARDYVEGPDYRGDVSDLILIAPPNRGSPLAGSQTLLQILEKSLTARAGREIDWGDDLGAVATDLSPGSAYLKRLAARPRREGVRYHILAGTAGFLSRDDRRTIQGRLDLTTRGSAVLGGLARLAAGPMTAGLDALTDGTGDGVVPLSSARLEGVDDVVEVPANHVELIRGPLLFPDDGPVACWPQVKAWLPRPVEDGDKPSP
jgi:pimeloyl-ACP methyl ester carboxylesterase